MPASPRTTVTQERPPEGASADVLAAVHFRAADGLCGGCLEMLAMLAPWPCPTAVGVVANDMRDPYMTKDELMEWRQSANALAQQLNGLGVLSTGWHDAFLAVPRHKFLQIVRDRSGNVIHTPFGDRAGAYLAEVYADRRLVAAVAQPPAPAGVTCSATRPSELARMLDALDVASGHRVLEVGTGTGYGTALLCHRLSDTAVTTIDIDPELVEKARQQLEHLAWRPYVRSGDGAAGVPERGPYARILVTAATTHIPAAWCSQLADGGRLVVAFGDEANAHLFVGVKAGRALVGKFRNTPVGLDELRALDGHRNNRYRVEHTTSLPAALPPAASAATDFHREDLAFWMRLSVPEVRLIHRVPADGQDTIDVRGYPHRRGDDMSQGPCKARGLDLDTDVPVVVSGRPALAPAVRDAWSRWVALGRPAPSRFGMTVADGGAATVWLDHDRNPVLRIRPVD